MKYKLAAIVAVMSITLSAESNAGLAPLKEFVNADYVNKTDFIITDGLNDAFDHWGMLSYSLGSIETKTKVRTIEDISTYLLHYSFTNTTNSDVYKNVSMRGDYGSDGATRTVYSESSYVINDDYGSDPYVATLYGDNEWASSNMSYRLTAQDDAYFDFNISLAAGETKSLLFYTTASTGSFVETIAVKDRLLTGEFTDHLTQVEKNSVMNFDFPQASFKTNNVSAPLIGGAGLLAFGLASMRRKSK